MTSPGIGASSVFGIAFEDLPEPVLAGTPTAGGALTAGTYKYVITALNANGETNISNEITVTTTAGNLTATLTWAAVTGATGYKVYRTAAAGATGTELLVTTLGVVLTYADAAVGAPAGALPLTNTAVTPGVYTAPTKFIPYLDESLKYMQETQWRRPIRNTSGLVGAIAGNSHVEGDITMEALTDCLIYFLAVSRCTYLRTGTGPYTYVFTPSSNAIPSKTASLVFVRNAVTFAYTGCVTGSFKFSVADGVLQFVPSVLGRDEASQTGPTGITWPISTPFGAGSYSIQVPTASQVFDADTFEFTSNDNSNPQYRLKSSGQGAQFISFGESDASLTMDRDFLNRTEYDAFKALTAQTITLAATKGASESITILLPVAFKDTYEVNIGAQGDLVRASITYQAAIDGTGKHYQITVVTPTEII